MIKGYNMLKKGKNTMKKEHPLSTIRIGQKILHYVKVVSENVKRDRRAHV